MSTIRNIGDAREAYEFAQTAFGELGRADPWRIFDTSFPAYNPSEFISTRGYRTVDAMRRDEQIKAAMRYKKHAVLSTGWQITSPEDQPKDWEPTVFVDHALRSLGGTLESKLEECMTAFEYGHSIGELVYQKTEDGKIGLKKLAYRKPHDIKYKQDIHGNILAVVQETPDGEINLPLEKLVLFSYQPEFSNPYGRCDFEAAYRPWWHKESAYRWLGMYMERLGIPPIFAMYNPDVYNKSNIDSLKTIIQRIQAGTVGVLPRRVPDDLEMWAPELSQGVANVFLPAIDKFDAHIARAILMPSQLGISPETSVGSQARATIIFDLFLYMIDSLRTTIAETVMQEQVVKRLVDLNFGEVEEYPLFTFLPLKEEAKPELFTAWLGLVNGGIVTPTEQDETHIRKALEMPEREEGDKDVREGGPNDPNVRLDMERQALESKIQNEKASADAKKQTGARNPSKTAKPTVVKKKPSAKLSEESDAEEFASSRISRIKQELDSLESSFESDIVRIVNDGIERTIERIRKKKDPSPQATLELEFPNEQLLISAMKSHMRKAFDTGAESLRNELSGETDQSETFDLRAVLESTLSFVRNIINTRAIFYSKNLINDLRETARQALLTGIELGEHEDKIADRLKQAYRKFWGEDLETGRAKNIARTESVYAWNQGRISEARRPEFKGLVVGWRYSAVLDSKTTPVCRHLHGKIIKDSDPMLPKIRPPRHYNCRSILDPMTITQRLKEEDYISEADKATGLELSMDGFT